MNRLALLLRRFGNAGAVANAFAELSLDEDAIRSAMTLESRIRRRDHARAAASIYPVETSRVA